MRVAHIVLASVATAALSLLHNTQASEACLRTLTAACDDGKTACIEDCYGRVLDDLEYVEAQDASDEDIEPPMTLSDDDAEDALGISVAYAGNERLVIDSLPRFTRWLYVELLAGLACSACYLVRISHDSERQTHCLRCDGQVHLGRPSVEREATDDPELQGEAAQRVRLGASRLL